MRKTENYEHQKRKAAILISRKISRLGQIWVKGGFRDGSDPNRRRIYLVSCEPYSIKTAVYADIITPYPHPQGVRLWSNGFSHGLKKCPPDTFLHQSADWCRPFESLSPSK